MFERNKKIKYYGISRPKSRPSRKKRLLVGTVLALGALGIAGQIEKGRDQ